jgi:hypothetical protein
MNDLEDMKRPSLQMSTATKLRINNLIFKQLKNHFKKSDPVNSSKSIKVLNSISENDSEIPPKYINSRAFHLKNSSLEKPFPAEKSRTCNNSVLRRKKKLESEKNGKTLREAFLKDWKSKEKSLNKKIMSKQRKLFEVISKKGPVFDDSPMKKFKTRSGSTLKLDVERVLHEEYLKDRIKFKLGSFRYYSHKKIWKPDCMKTLKKAEKLILSLPRTRNL